MKLGQVEVSLRIGWGTWTPYYYHQWACWGTCNWLPIRQSKKGGDVAINIPRS